MGKIKNLVQKGKDLSLSKALMTLGEKYVDRFGKIVTLSIDSKNNDIHIKILLRGESTPVDIHVNGYNIIEEGDSHFIAAEKIHVSREWINVLAQEHIQGRRFKISSTSSKILEKLAFS